MRTVVTLAVGAALLLTAGCSAGQPSGAPRVSAALPGTASADSSAPASNPPAVSTRPASSRPASSRPASSRPASTHPASSASSPATGSAAVPAPHTEQIVRRPVTSTGRAAPGYTTVVLPASRDLLDCRQYPHFSNGSPSAVDDGIARCLPSMEYALACWKGPTATTALCYRNPWQRQVDRVNILGPLPATQAPKQPTPLGLVLGNGSRCWLRDGGAWSDLDGHPDMFGIYSCDGRTTVWASQQSDGINRTQAVWRVRVAPMSGHGRLRTVTVRTAYFVGTSRS
jgi:hypothetical protein